MYAIIATGGKQYKVAEGDIINVEKLGVEADQTVTFDAVITVNDGDVRWAVMLAQLYSVTLRARRLLFTSTRERPDTTTRMVTDSLTQR